MAIIIAGPEKTKFTVHKSILLEASPWFRAALNGNFKEAASGRVMMLEDDRGQVEYFVQWLYFGPANEMTPAHGPGRTARIKRIVDQYVFADKVECLALMKDMIRAFFDLLMKSDGPVLSREAIHYIYDASKKTLPLRRITALYYAWFMGPDEWRQPMWLKIADEVPEFGNKVSLAMFEKHGEYGASIPLGNYIDKLMKAEIWN